jgi:hypothetical protein
MPLSESKILAPMCASMSCNGWPSRRCPISIFARLPGTIYDLNESEMELVLAFRRSLADAGIDLFLEERITPEQLATIQQLFA